MDSDLTAVQEQSMLDLWNSNPSQPPSIKEILKHLHGKEMDGRSPEARAVRVALSKHELKARVDGAVKIELNESHKKFIQNNAKTMTAVEMARVLFSNPALTNLNGETRSVNEFIKTLDESLVMNSGLATQDVPDGDYEPPQSLDRVVKRANAYRHDKLDKDKITPQEKKCLEKLIEYLNIHRLCKQINTFDNVSDRKSFEDAFIRYTWDKPDLSQEEVDEYIVLASEVVISFKIQRRSEKLQSMLDDITDGSDAADKIKISMSLVDAIGNHQKEYNESVKRQQTLLTSLKEKRSEKISKKIKDNASVLNIINEWKNEEKRANWIKLAEIEQRIVAEEVDKLDGMDAIKCRILGLTKEEIKFG